MRCSHSDYEPPASSRVARAFSSRLRDMDGQRQIVPVGVGIIMIASAMLSPPLYVSLPLLAVGIFVLSWGLAARHIEPLLNKSSVGRLVADGMHRLEAIAEGRDETYYERKTYIDRIWPSLEAAEKTALRTMLISGRPIAVSDAVWQSLRSEGLVEGDFHGPGGNQSEP